eukprot:UN24566
MAFALTRDTIMKGATCFWYDSNGFGVRILGAHSPGTDYTKTDLNTTSQEIVGKNATLSIPFETFSCCDGQSISLKDINSDFNILFATSSGDFGYHDGGILQ